MLDAAIAFVWVDCAGNETLLDNTSGRPSSAAGTMSLMRLADGFATATPLADSEFHGLCRSFGVDSTDPDLATIGDRMRNQDKLGDALRKVKAKALSTPLAEAMARMEANDVPCGVAVPVHQLPHDAQVRANELLSETLHPALGRVQQPRPPALFGGTPAHHKPHAPTLGQHTDDVLRELGFDDERITALRADKVVA
jgi:crotonobetainyl-CoA:carnitine CoA-transferase CaiB-like acyl-CoA transferase